MAPSRKRSLSGALPWERRASQVAKTLKISDAELKKAVRQAIVRKAADLIVEGDLLSTIKTAVALTREPKSVELGIAGEDIEKLAREGGGGVFPGELH